MHLIEAQDFGQRLRFHLHRVGLHGVDTAVLVTQTPQDANEFTSSLNRLFTVVGRRWTSAMGSPSWQSSARCGQPEKEHITLVFPAVDVMVKPERSQAASKHCDVDEAIKAFLSHQERAHVNAEALGSKAREEDSWQPRGPYAPADQLSMASSKHLSGMLAARLNLDMREMDGSCGLFTGLLVRQHGPGNATKLFTLVSSASIMHGSLLSEMSLMAQPRLTSFSREFSNGDRRCVETMRPQLPEKVQQLEHGDFDTTEGSMSASSSDRIEEARAAMGADELVAHVNARPATPSSHAASSTQISAQPAQQHLSSCIAGIDDLAIVSSHPIFDARRSPELSSASEYEGRGAANHRSVPVFGMPHDAEAAPRAAHALRRPRSDQYLGSQPWPSRPRASLPGRPAHLHGHYSDRVSASTMPRSPSGDKTPAPVHPLLRLPRQSSDIADAWLMDGDGALDIAAQKPQTPCLGEDPFRDPLPALEHRPSRRSRNWLRHADSGAANLHFPDRMSLDAAALYHACAKAGRRTSFSDPFLTQLPVPLRLSEQESYSSFDNQGAFQGQLARVREGVASAPASNPQPATAGMVSGRNSKLSDDCGTTAAWRSLSHVDQGYALSKAQSFAPQKSGQHRDPWSQPELLHSFDGLHDEMTAEERRQRRLLLFNSGSGPMAHQTARRSTVAEGMQPQPSASRTQRLSRESARAKLATSEVGAWVASSALATQGSLCGPDVPDAPFAEARGTPLWSSSHPSSAGAAELRQSSDARDAGLDAASGKSPFAPASCITFKETAAGRESEARPSDPPVPEMALSHSVKAALLERLARTRLSLHNPRTSAAPPFPE